MRENTYINGSDLTIFTNGLIIHRVLQAADNLAKEGVNVTVVEVHTLKPLDIQFIVEILEKTGGAVTVEDHNIIGGLGSAIAELIAEHIPVPLVRVGLQDVFPESGEAEALLDHYEMGNEDIVKAVKKAIMKKEKKN